MKAVINTLSNTYKMVRLLSNPEVGAYLEAQLSTETAQPTKTPEAHLSKNNAFFHKHYIIQVVN